MTLIGGGMLLNDPISDLINEFLGIFASDPPAEVPLKDLKGKLSPREAESLEKQGEHPHDLKQNDSTKDLYKDRKGNVYVDNKDGTGIGVYANVKLRR